MGCLFLEFFRVIFSSCGWLLATEMAERETIIVTNYTLSDWQIQKGVSLPLWFTFPLTAGRAERVLITIRYAWVFLIKMLNQDFCSFFYWVVCSYWYTSILYIVWTHTVTVIHIETLSFCWSHCGQETTKQVLLGWVACLLEENQASVSIFVSVSWTQTMNTTEKIFKTRTHQWAD